MNNLFYFFAVCFIVTSCNNAADNKQQPTTNVSAAESMVKDTAQQTVSINYGDLVFIDVNCGAFCDAIVGVTPSYKDLPVNHVGIKVKFNNEPYIIEAGNKGVVMISTGEFLKKANSLFMVAKVKDQYAPLIDSAMAFAIRQIGKSYDDAFVLNNDKYYCSELIYDAFKYANDNKPFFNLAPMTFKGKNSAELLPDWVAYFKDLNIPVPEGALGCNPGALSLSDKIEIKGTLFKPDSSKASAYQ